MTFEEFWDEASEQSRMRQLPIERFLIDTADGWVMRQARFYRGHIQIEGEEAGGRALLLELLARTEWVAENFLLARETARVLPHGVDTDRSREIRRLAQVIAELELSFERMRIEIHTNPSFSTADRVSDWLTDYRWKPESDAEVIADVEKLIVLLTESFDPTGRHARLAEAQARLQGRAAIRETGVALAQLDSLDVPERLSHLGNLLSGMRRLIEGDLRPSDKLQLLDLMPDLELEMRLLARELLAQPHQRRSDHLAAAGAPVAAAEGHRFPSKGERGALDVQLARALHRTSAAGAPATEMMEATLALPEYQDILALDARDELGVGTVRHVRECSPATLRSNPPVPLSSTICCVARYCCRWQTCCSRCLPMRKP